MSRILRALIALALAALVLFNAPPALAQPPCGPAVLHVYDGSQMAEAPIENTYDRGPPTNHSDVQHRRADFPPSIGPLACPANVTTYDYDTHSELGTTGTTTIHDPKVNVRVAETGAEGASLSARASRVAANAGTRLGWSTGDDIYSLTKAGNKPAWSTVRGRFWKNEASSPQYGSWTDDQLARMRTGRAPQRYNPDKGGMESMDLSHEPIPFRDGGTSVIPRWPQDHAAVDPFRHPGY